MESAVGFALAVVLHPDVAAHRNPPPPSATLVTASVVPLPGDVDCNSPAVWDVENRVQTLKVVTSAAGQTGVADGARWDRMGDWAPSLLVDPPPGRLWMESVIADEAGTWYGFYHNEIPAMVCGRPELAMPRIGAARSFDQGASWEDLGIVLEAPPGSEACGTSNQYFVGGVGDMSVVLDHDQTYLYLYFSQYSAEPAAQGIAVARLPWARRDEPVGQVDVWTEGVWLPPEDVEGVDDASTPFIYASSAATYGDGSQGFDDDPSLAALERLRPLNLYGWTKHAFDLLVTRTLSKAKERPPQWAGLKFFNVYGPNEYHKGKMISVVKVKHDEVAAGGPAKLFKSDQPGLADGQQQRDFIWVGDVADVMLWLLDTPRVSGLFNLGTGQARSYLDLAHAVCDAAGQPRQVEFVDMPTKLRGQYQSFTQADMTRLRAAGYPGQFTPLEDGIRRYVRDYLASFDLYA